MKTVSRGFYMSIPYRKLDIILTVIAHRGC